MVETGIKKPVNRILERGAPSVITSLNVGLTTNMYPGRLVKKGSTDYDVLVNDGVSQPIGWLGWEQADMNNRPATPATAYGTGDEAPVLRGGDFTITGKLAAGFDVVRGDLLIPWVAGTLAPAVKFAKGYGIRIPFEKKTSEFDTPIVLPANLHIHDCLVYVDTNVASSSIKVGIKSGETGGDADGFLDDASCVNAGWVTNVLENTSAANITLGEFLRGAVLEDVTSPAVHFVVPNYHLTDGTAKTVTYTTSEHDVDGYFYLVMTSPGTYPVAVAEEAKNAAATLTDIVVRSII